MSLQCLRCNKEFKYAYLLQRHNNRKHKCKETVQLENSDLRLKRIDTELSETKKDLHNTKKVLNELVQKFEDESQDSTTKFDCRFCSKTFNFKTNLTKHLKVCKYKIDNVSIYEKELMLEPKMNGNNLKCPFCSKQYTKKKSLSQHNNRGCRESYVYEAELMQRVQENRKAAAANITNNNTTNNNNVIINLPAMNAFGKENHDYITTKSLLKELEKYKSINSNDISNIVSKFTKLIHANPAHPENHNVLFKSLNSGYARVFNGNIFEERQSTDVQDEIMQNVGNLITKGCDDHDYKNAKDSLNDVFDDMDVTYGERLEDVKEGKATRPLSKCRNAIRAALFTHNTEIENTQRLT